MSDCTRHCWHNLFVTSEPPAEYQVCCWCEEKQTLVAGPVAVNRHGIYHPSTAAWDRITSGTVAAGIVAASDRELGG